VGFQGHFRLDRTYDWSSLTKAVSEYKKLGLEVYITEVDYGDTDQIAAAKPSRWSAQMDSAQKKAYHDFTAAAVAGGANWICLWGVADNTNSYWRMGQNALLFNEQYQPKPAYYGFHQGITDGFSGAKPGNHKPLAPEPKRIAPRVTGKKIYMNDIISHYRLFTVSGKPVEAAQFHDNMIDIGPISKGIYILKVFANTSGAHIVKVVR